MKKIFKKCILPCIMLALTAVPASKVFAGPPEVIVDFMFKNDCYNCKKQNSIKGIMVHSTVTPGVGAKRWKLLWNIPSKEGGREVCVHAFLDDETICQYLPWNHRAWHCGRSYPGGPSGNDTHISFEICEPKGIVYDKGHEEIVKYDPHSETSEKYFESIWKNSLWLCTKLCVEFNINPEEIISHSEGFKKGIASDHDDPEHWWQYHDKNMDIFRSEVFDRLMRLTFESILKDEYSRRYFLN